MADELQVDPERLREAARFIAGKAQGIRDRVKQLDDTVGKELLADGWRGKSASAYDESWVEWKAGADKVVDALKTSATKLVDAANRYQAQDAATSGKLTQYGDRM
ncbi:WXG100 family type VII secretion target [Nocardia arthritidis]|uniref:WXG100 family type VII secretion target n=1 Tax=Nocardia arthritidis TaxID=228602 RepID=UPI00142D6923|nr:WXG100 family type VII secretion target [Nocardia arthritidis]